jgi:hypothetical protein
MCTGLNRFCYLYSGKQAGQGMSVNAIIIKKINGEMLWN